ncbi:LAMI_0D00958g1_1 [Lachancea mirantina]|uniref:LAMI_0D00958g1_1 n=1 Tax=Lachancea mirantina TaxID=1230905 RepID=A0A1G4J8M7_9SACH|nr:LAMI_0D00958g1_1 [Lachancea mirantina]
MTDKHQAEITPLLGTDKRSKPRSKKSGSRGRRRKAAFKGRDGGHQGNAENFEPAGSVHGSGATGNDFEQADSWGMLHDVDEEGTSSRNSVVAQGQFAGSLIDHRPSIAAMEAVNSSPAIRKVRRPSTSRRLHGYSFSGPTRQSPDHEETSGVAKEAVRNHLHGARDDVVIDVDALMDHVKRQRRSSGSSPNSSDNSEHPYNSQPSSRRSSVNSSLNDVCLPLDDEENLAKVWPDVAVLEEFSKEETERLRRQATEDAENFHFQYDDESDINDESGNYDGVLFSKPIVTNIDVPELGNTRINEAEHLESGRLRPKKLAPWHLRRNVTMGVPYMANIDRTKAQGEDVGQAPLMTGPSIQYPPHIISNNPEHFRFTYFREDLDSTIHSPTISGLLQPGQKFEELFVNAVYNNQSRSPPSETKSSTPSQQNHLQNHTTRQSASLDLEDISPFWLDVSNPTEEEMKVLSKAFGIHPLTTEDIYLGEVREKVELFKDYYLVCFRSFDIVAERHAKKRKQQQHESVNTGSESNENSRGWFSRNLLSRRRSSTNRTAETEGSSVRRRIQKEIEENEKYKRKSGDRRKPRAGELEPLNVYIIVFRTGVLTFHFAPTPHPINVRRRARLLKDYLNVTSDWIAYALIDDITDAFAPMIELIEDEVYDIEDAILKMHHSSDDSSSDESSDDEESAEDFPMAMDGYSRKMSVLSERRTCSSRSTRGYSTSDSTLEANIIGWRRKGDMLRRIGECRKRVMSILRLLGSKADVIKGFAKRCNEEWNVAPRSEIGMYLGDIQDHIITMVSSLNHYEKLLSRSHSNYLAQINIDMTKVNNDMNDVLGKITILGTVVLPMNIITGLWGMNVLVPGQDEHSLKWFTSITGCMVIFAYWAYVYTKRRFGF